MIYVTDSLLLGISITSNFPSLHYTTPYVNFVRISDDFLKVGEMPQCGTIESKRVSALKVLGNTVKQPSREVVPILFSYVRASISLHKNCCSLLFFPIQYRAQNLVTDLITVSLIPTSVEQISICLLTILPFSF